MSIILNCVLFKYRTIICSLHNCALELKFEKLFFLINYIDAFNISI